MNEGSKNEVIARLERLEQENTRLKRIGLVMILAVLFQGCAGGKPPATTPAPNQSRPAKKDIPLFKIAKNRKFGLINSAGQIVVEPQFDGLDEWSEGLVSVCIGRCDFVQDVPPPPPGFKIVPKGDEGVFHTKPSKASTVSRIIKAKW